MANVHLQEAAHNLRRAMDDVQRQLAQTKSENDQHIQQLQKRIQEITDEKRNENILSAQADSDQERALHRSNIQNLERELGDINREIFRRNDELRKIQADLQKQKLEFSQIATRLDGLS